jgi:hypothetical protein
LAAKIIRAGIGYARRWGFKPHPDLAEIAPLFADADPDACDAVIPLGMDGKPFFVSGPHDDPRAVVDKLMKTAGPGNFDYLVGIPGPPPARRRRFGFW